MVVNGYLLITLPHYHHYADLSEVTELPYCLSDIFCLECVSKIRSVLSIIFHAIYGAVSIQLTHFSYDDCENTCTWSYYHHEFGRMTHLPLFRVKSWNNGVRCMSVYVLMIYFLAYDLHADRCWSWPQDQHIDPGHTIHNHQPQTITHPRNVWIKSWFFLFCISRNISFYRSAPRLHTVYLSMNKAHPIGDSYPYIGNIYIYIYWIIFNII